jgi:hypothetical protein
MSCCLNDDQTFRFVLSEAITDGILKSLVRQWRQQ